MSDTIITRAYLPMDTYERLRAVTRTVSGATMTRIIRDALESWLEEVEREEWACKGYDRDEVIKPPGAPYPERDHGIRRGRPLDSPSKDLRQISFRLDPDFYERFYNALFWRADWLSHVVTNAVEAKLKDFE